MMGIFLYVRSIISSFLPTLFPSFSPLLASRGGSHAHLLTTPCHLWCIGDIHGCHSEFLSLLQIIESREGPSYLSSVVLVGDLVNKGPSSNLVLSHARKNMIMSVRGNHDISALSVSKGTKAVKPHQRDKYAWVKDITDDDVRYLESLPCTISAVVGGEKYTIVHAGILPGEPLSGQKVEDMTTMRLIHSPSSGVWETTEDDEKGVPWGGVYKGEEGTVIFGHDARRGLQEYDHAVGLDTGCVYGRSITAVRIGGGDREFISVQCEKEDGYAPVKGKRVECGQIE